MLKQLVISLLAMTLMACATTHHQAATDNHDNQKSLGIANQSYLAEGKRLFEEGFYKSAMHELLPIAVNGNEEAQYAVGFMYYYGYGVSQDTEVGFFWIQRSANQHYEPAMQALQSIDAKRQDRSPQRKPYPSAS